MAIHCRLSTVGTPVTGRMKKDVNSEKRGMKLALVASSGGHLYELTCLRDFWGRYQQRFWVSFPTQDAKTLLANEAVYWAAHPTNRSLRALVLNFWLAWRLLRREHPDAVISTGAGVAVPFLILARLMHVRTVYIESITRLSELSLTGRLVYPFVDRVLVQWEELAANHEKAEYHGRIV